MANEDKMTTDHDGIRRWTEERGGKPATVFAGLLPGDGAEGEALDRVAPYVRPTTMGAATTVPMTVSWTH